MSLELKHLDQNWQPISEKESGDIGFFVKQFWEEDILRIEEIYENDSLTHINYYLDVDQNPNTYLNLAQAPNLSIFTNPIFKYHYKKYDVHVFINGELKNKRLQVFTKDYRHIYDKSYDVFTGEVNYFEKNLYIEEPNLTYEFQYNDDGVFKKLTIYDPENIVDTDDHTIYPHTVGIGKNPYDFAWEGFEYFESAEPVIPEKSYSW